MSVCSIIIQNIATVVATARYNVTASLCWHHAGQAVRTARLASPMLCQLHTEFGHPAMPKRAWCKLACTSHYNDTAVKEADTTHTW